MVLFCPDRNEYCRILQTAMANEVYVASVFWITMEGERVMDKHVVACVAILGAIMGASNDWSGWGWFLVVAVWFLWGAVMDIVEQLRKDISPLRDLKSTERNNI